MGKFEEGDLRSIVKKQFQLHKPVKVDADAVLSIEKEVAVGIKAELQKEFGGNWNVILGRGIVANLGLHKDERSAHFTYQEDQTLYHVLLFEYNPKP